MAFELNAGIPLQFQSQAINPLQLAMGAQQFAAQRENMLGQREVRESMTENRALEADKRRRALADQDALDTAAKSDGSIDDIIKRLPGHMQAGARENAYKAEEAAQKAAKARTEAQTADADMKGEFAAQWKAYGFDPQAGQLLLGIASKHGHDFSDVQEQMAAGKSPEQIANALIAASPKQRELADREKGTASTVANQQAALPGVVADSAVKQQVAAGTKAGLTPEQQAMGKREQQRIGLEQQRINAEKQRVNDAKGDKTELSPEGLDAAAMMFARTGQLPALGNGDKDTRKKIINRAAVLMPGLDVASAKADYGANTDSLKTLQKQRDTIGAFETTAKSNIQLFLDQAGKVVDTGSPMANTAARLVSGKMLGSPDQAAYDAARQVAVNEIAKIVAGGGLNAVLSDSARQEISHFNPKDATLKQTVAVMRLLTSDMENRQHGLDDQIAAIQGRIKKSGTPDAPKSSGFTVTEIKK